MTQIVNATPTHYQEIARIRHILVDVLMQVFPPADGPDLTPIQEGRSSILSTTLLYMCGEFLQRIKDPVMKAEIVERYQKQLAEIAFTPLEAKINETKES